LWFLSYGSADFFRVVEKKKEAAAPAPTGNIVFR
jgi:hypothetical protein